LSVLQIWCTTKCTEFPNLMNTHKNQNSGFSEKNLINNRISKYGKQIIQHIVTRSQNLINKKEKKNPHITKF